MVTELEQKTNDYQRQLKEFESKCERLEREVNRVNAQRLADKNTRELAVDEVSHECSCGMTDLMTYVFMYV